MVAALFSSQTDLCILLNPQVVTEGQAKGGLRKFLPILLEDPGNSSGEEFYRAQPAREYSAFVINGNFKPIFQESNISFSCCKFEPSHYCTGLTATGLSLQRERLKLRSLTFFNKLPHSTFLIEFIICSSLHLSPSHMSFLYLLKSN